eukprot:Nitzschia sp. Nitz4//scaffold51_size120721//61613//62572//NITZ4_003731-RA/size120721-processed-gene-0.126-mRNA-1//1//CDS//3329553874//8990//frame0
MAEKQRTRLDRFLWALLVGILFGVQLNCSFSLESPVSHAGSTEAETFSGISSSLSPVHGFQLAYQESLGYFLNTISDEEWKQRQVWARNATLHRYVGHPKRLWDKPNLWYYNNYDPMFSCPFQKRVRGIGDGPKWTCDPHQLRRIAQNGDCLLYSIGSNGNYQWEDGMFLETGGFCEIHVFDYSQNYTRKKNQERNIHFHQLGLQGSNEPIQGPLWRTFPQMVKELGHENRTIHVLKIDCEGCEWDSYPDWIGLDIRQVLVETHSLPENKSQGLAFFNSFLNNNFILYSKEVNPWGGGQYVEFSYLRMHPDFLGDNVHK